MISRQFFPTYANEIAQKKPKSIKDCAMLYSDCRGPMDPVPEETSNAVEDVAAADEARKAPQLDQVQRFVVGQKRN